MLDLHRTLPLVLSLLCAAACGDDGSTESGTEAAADSAADGGEPAGANCPSRCAMVSTACGAPADIATAACADVCGSSPTEAQLECLESSSCAELTGLLGGQTVCGIGDPGNTSNTTNGSGPSTTTTTTSTTDSPDTSTPGGMLGDPCDCGNPTVLCEGTENGCQFSFSGESYSCLVNSGDVSTGVCTQTCDPDNDQCSEGVCSPEIDYLQGNTFYVCK